MEEKRKGPITEHYEIQIRDLNKQVPLSYEKTTEDEHESLASLTTS